MVEFSSSQDSMVQIQREDASNRLAAAGTGTIKFKRVWQCAVAGLVAVGLFAGGLCYNLLHYVPPVFADTTNWQVQRLLDLKSSVDRNVYFTADTKEVINGELDSILEIIYNEETGEVLWRGECEENSCLVGELPAEENRKLAAYKIRDGLK